MQMTDRSLAGEMLHIFKHQRNALHDHTVSHITQWEQLLGKSDIKHWGGFGETHACKGTLRTGMKVARPVCKTAWVFLKMLKIG